MAWKNQQDARDYHRKYKRKQRAELVKNGFTTDGKVRKTDRPIKIPKMAKEDKDNFTDIIETPEAKKVIDVIKKATADEETGEQDPIIKTMETLQKYAPLVKTILGGFLDGIKTMQPVQQAPQIAKPLEPVGYRSYSAKPPLEQLKIRYSNPQMVSQFEAYEQALSGVVSQQYQADQAELSSYDRKMASVTPKQNEELYGTPVFTAPPTENNIPQATPEEQKQANDEFEAMIKSSSSEPVKEPTEPTEPNKREPQPKGDDELTQIKTVIQKDVEEQLNKALEFVASMKDDDFLKHVNEPKGFMMMAKAYKEFGMSVQMKEALKNTTVEEITTLFKEKCSGKYTLIEKGAKLVELKKLLGELIK